MLRYGSNALGRLTKAVLRPQQFACTRTFASEAEFEDAQKRLSALSEEPANDIKLKVYALYKQATSGDCDGDRPGMSNFVARAKYDAWAKVSGLSPEDARQEYVDLIKELREADS